MEEVSKAGVVTAVMEENPEAEIVESRAQAQDRKIAVFGVKNPARGPGR
jgi:hypothetical protein